MANKERVDVSRESVATERENSIFMVCVLSCNSLIDAGIRFYLFLVCFAIHSTAAEEEEGHGLRESRHRMQCHSGLRSSTA